VSFERGFMKKILIAEDDKFLASAYRVKLSKAQYEVKTVSNGDEALQALDSFLPDLIILDLMMPVRDGFSFLEEIKKNAKWKNTPIIVASNLSQPDDVVKAVQMGANDYIVKTDLTMKEVLAKIKKILEDGV